MVVVLLIFMMLSASSVSALGLERAPYIQRQTPTEAVIVWRTDEVSSATVWIGDSPKQLKPFVQGASSTQHEILVGEAGCRRAAVDALAWLRATLHAPAGDNAVQRSALKMERPSRARRGAPLSCTQAAEVLDGPRHDIGAERELDAPRRLRANRDVEEDARVGSERRLLLGARGARAHEPELAL